jgi:hypothetical protein
VIEFILILAMGGLVIGGVIVGARWLDSQRTLIAYRLRLPNQLTIDDVARWLGIVAASKTPPKWSLLLMPPLGLEIVATTSGIEHYLLVTESEDSALLGMVRAGLPGARLEEVSDFPTRRPHVLVAGEVATTNRHRPLAVDRAQATSAAFLASLQPLGPGEEVRWQVWMTSAGTPEPVHSASPNPDDQWWASYLVEGEPPADAEAVRAMRIKRAEPGLHVAMRLGVNALSQARAWRLFRRTWSTLHGQNAPGVRVVRQWLPSFVVASRMRRRVVPTVAWQWLNARELVGFIGFPSSALSLPGLSQGTARQLPPPPNLPHRDAIQLGVSNYPGMTGHPITLATEDRLRHMTVIAPTGGGKSWLLSRMILSDIAARRGVFVVDPKGDLITDVLARIDTRDADRVIVLDAARRDRPVGLNVLGHAHDEASRELVVDNLLTVFRAIWADSWGPRSDSLLRMGLAALVNARGTDGSVLTLTELVPLLTQPAFRRFVVDQRTVPDAVRTYWQRHDQRSEAAREEMIQPLLHKVEAFTSRTAIKLMLGQSEGVDLRSVFSERAVVLVSLAKGALGETTASLLGSLIVSLFWQETLARVRVPADRRRPAFAYVDEASDVMRLPVPLADAFSQSRGLSVGWITAMQYLHSRVPDAIKAALLSTVRTQLALAVEHEDALLLAKRFPPLTVDDLTGLDSYEAAVRLCVNGVTRAPVTMTTLPLGPVVREADELAAASRQRYGQPRGDVEAAIKARITPPGRTDSSGAFGRRARGGSA